MHRLRGPEVHNAVGLVEIHRPAAAAAASAAAVKERRALAPQGRDGGGADTAADDAVAVGDVLCGACRGDAAVALGMAGRICYRRDGRFGRTR